MHSNRALCLRAVIPDPSPRQHSWLRGVVVGLGWLGLGHSPWENRQLSWNHAHCIRGPRCGSEELWEREVGRDELITPHLSKLLEHACAEGVTKHLYPLPLLSVRMPWGSKPFPKTAVQPHLWEHRMTEGHCWSKEEEGKHKFEAFGVITEEGNVLYLIWCGLLISTARTVSTALVQASHWLEHTHSIPLAFSRCLNL